MSENKRPWPYHLDEAHKHIADELKRLDGLDRVSLDRLYTALGNAHALSLAAFGSNASPDHVLKLLQHLLDQAV